MKILAYLLGLLGQMLIKFVEFDAIKICGHFDDIIMGIQSYINYNMELDGIIYAIWSGECMMTFGDMTDRVALLKYERFANL